MPASDPPTDEGTPSPPPPPPPRPLPLASALPFWFYLAAAVSLLALLLPHVLPSSSPAPLPPPLLARHLAAGRVLKLTDPAPGLFAVSSRPSSAAATAGPAPRVLILPGLAAGTFSFRHVLPALASRGVHAAALDLPGQGLSPAPPPAAAAQTKRASALHEILDRGVFHAFEHLVETGEVPYQDSGAGPPPPTSSPYAPAHAAAAVARAVEALGVAPVHLVLHDSALAAGAAFASANPGMVRSVTLVDTTASLPAFPAAVFEVPVLGRLVMRVPALFRGLVRMCCARGMGPEEAEAHRAAMRGEGRAEGVVEAWKVMNQSFQLGEWRSSSEDMRKLPMMVLWSGSWSDKWIDEGKKVVGALPDVRFVYHSGGRWPQEDATEEIVELVAEFVTQSEEAQSGRIEQPVV